MSNDEVGRAQGTVHLRLPRGQTRRRELQEHRDETKARPVWLAQPDEEARSQMWRSSRATKWPRSHTCETSSDRAIEDERVKWMRKDGR